MKEIMGRSSSATSLASANSSTPSTRPPSYVDDGERSSFDEKKKKPVGTGAHEEVGESSTASQNLAKPKSKGLSLRKATHALTGACPKSVARTLGWDKALLHGASNNVRFAVEHLGLRAWSKQKESIYCSFSSFAGESLKQPLMNLDEACAQLDVMAQTCKDSAEWYSAVELTKEIVPRGRYQSQELDFMVTLHALIQATPEQRSLFAEHKEVFVAVGRRGVPACVKFLAQVPDINALKDILATANLFDSPQQERVRQVHAAGYHLSEHPLAPFSGTTFAGLVAHAGVSDPVMKFEWPRAMRREAEPVEVYRLLATIQHIHDLAPDRRMLYLQTATKLWAMRKPRDSRAVYDGWSLVEPRFPLALLRTLDAHASDTQQCEAAVNEVRELVAASKNEQVLAFESPEDVARLFNCVLRRTPPSYPAE